MRYKYSCYRPQLSKEKDFLYGPMHRDEGCRPIAYTALHFLQQKTPKSWKDQQGSYELVFG